MNLKEKSKYKSDFKKELDKFAKKLKEYVSTENGDWSIKGFIDLHKNIYTISSDTKIISKILEIHIFPQILEFANSIGYIVEHPEKQNSYPDITFINKKHKDVKFAVDIKTTYRKKSKADKFTLGSHGTYFKKRDEKKNIQYPYNQYFGHFCLCIIYSRTDLINNLAETEIYQVKELLEAKESPNEKVGEREVATVKNLKSITSVIKGLEFFAAEKWKIASDKRGSGNTANIGSIDNIDGLINEKGTFSNLSEEWFDEYWINYGSATMIKEGTPVKITNIKDFLEFKGRTDLIELVVVKSKKKVK